jgi:hypothetical protein
MADHAIHMSSSASGISILGVVVGAIIVLGT